jgi:hypothetical protein
MSPGSSHHHASSPSIIDKDVSRILFLLRLSVLHYGGGFLQDPLSATPLRPPLWRRMSKGSSHHHTSPPSVIYESVSSILFLLRLSVLCVMEEDVSRILSLSGLSVLCCGEGCLQDPLTVTPLRPPLWKRMSPGSSYRQASLSSVIRTMSPRSSLCHASPSSVMEEDVSKILSPSRLSVLHYG